MTIFLKTDNGLLSERFIVRIEPFETGKVQVAFLAGPDVRYTIATIPDLELFLTGKSGSL